MMLLSPSCKLIIFFADFQAHFRLLGAWKEHLVPPTPFPNRHGGLPNPTTLPTPGLPFLIVVLPGTRVPENEPDDARAGTARRDDGWVPTHGRRQNSPSAGAQTRLLGKVGSVSGKAPNCSTVDASEPPGQSPLLGPFPWGWERPPCCIPWGQVIPTASLGSWRQDGIIHGRLRCRQGAAAALGLLPSLGVYDNPALAHGCRS